MLKKYMVKTKNDSHVLTCIHGCTTVPTKRVWLRSVFKTLLFKSVLRNIVFCHYINAQHINNHLSTLFHIKSNGWTSVHKSGKEGTREGPDPPILPPIFTSSPEGVFRPV